MYKQCCGTAEGSVTCNFCGLLSRVQAAALSVLMNHVQVHAVVLESRVAGHRLPLAAYLPLGLHRVKAYNNSVVVLECKNVQ